MFLIGEAYRNNEAVKRWVRRMLALPLAPLQSFMHGINDIAYRAVVDIAPAAIDQEKVQMVHQYLANVWIDMVDSTFAPFLWNHWQSDKIRTINAVEGWHHQVNALLNKPHPNIYRFLDLLKHQQRKVSVRVAQLANGANNNVRKTKYVNVDRAIANLKLRFAQGQIDLPNYLDAVGHVLKW